MLRPEDSDQSWDPENVTLPRGRYLVKVYLDQNELLRDDPTALLSEDDYRGAVETRGDWGEGFKNAKLVSAADIDSAGKVTP